MLLADKYLQLFFHKKHQKHQVSSCCFLTLNLFFLYIILIFFSFFVLSWLWSHNWQTMLICMWGWRLFFWWGMGTSAAPPPQACVRLSWQRRFSCFLFCYLIIISFSCIHANNTGKGLSKPVFFCPRIQEMFCI